MGRESPTESTSDVTTVPARTIHWHWLRWPETWCYPLFGMADIGLTYLLIGYYGHTEGNPVARFFVDGWGLKGMVWFKLGMVSGVLAIVHQISQTKPAVARRVVQFAVATVVGVVCYSIVLVCR